jgi:hypothetical protein
MGLLAIAGADEDERELFDRFDAPPLQGLREGRERRDSNPRPPA